MVFGGLTVPTATGLATRTILAVLNLTLHKLSNIFIRSKQLIMIIYDDQLRSARNVTALALLAIVAYW